MKFYNQPPNFWDNFCLEHKSFFHHSDWHSILKKGFDTETVYVWDESRKNGFSISIFKKAIFKIGYIGFPVGGTITGEAFDEDLVSSIYKIIPQGRVHILRIPSGNFHPCSLSTQNINSCPETYIQNLDNWSQNNLSKHCRRDIKKSIRENAKIELLTDPDQGIYIYNLYKNTIKRNDGALRYTCNYFKSIIELSNSKNEIRCTCIKKDNEIIAFLVVTLNGNTANYLHGAINYDYRKTLPNDLLIYDAIVWAKNSNIASFNFMCSPVNQLNLIKYKEKWGGLTTSNNTFEYILSPFHSALFKASSMLYSYRKKFNLSNV